MTSLIKKIKSKAKIVSIALFDENFSKVYRIGNRFLESKYHIKGEQLTQKEIHKKVKRHEVINYCLKTLNRRTTYLEIGVRYLEHNFNKIEADQKYSVDPGLENLENPVDYKMTSDVFFDKLKNDEILKSDIKFDVIFIDGLHLAEQVERDIENSLRFIKQDGFIVLHDCNPPTEYHAREEYDDDLSPASGYWNGTTWKAFFKYRKSNEISSCCIDSDWGIGVLSKQKILESKTNIENLFYEYKILDKTRKDSLGLISFDQFKRKVNQGNIL